MPFLAALSALATFLSFLFFSFFLTLSVQLSIIRLLLDDLIKAAKKLRVQMFV